MTMAAADCDHDIASEMIVCVVNMPCTCVCWRPTSHTFNLILGGFIYILYLSMYMKVGVIFSYIIVMVQHMHACSTLYIPNSMVNCSNNNTCISTFVHTWCGHICMYNWYMYYTSIKFQSKVNCIAVSIVQPAYVPEENTKSVLLIRGRYCQSVYWLTYST